MSQRSLTPIPCSACPLNRRCDFVVCFMRQEPPPAIPDWALPR